jgi:hypothetical protein
MNSECGVFDAARAEIEAGTTGLDSYVEYEDVRQDDQWVKPESGVRLDPNAVVATDSLLELASGIEDFQDIWRGTGSGLAGEPDHERELAVIALGAGWSDQEIADLLIHRRREFPDTSIYYDPWASPSTDGITDAIAATRAIVDHHHEKISMGRLREEVEAIVGSIRGGDTYPTEEQRKMLMLYISRVMMVPIREMLKYGTDEPTYVFYLDNGLEIEIMKTVELMSKSKLMSRFIAAVGDAPMEIKNDDWQLLQIAMLKAFGVVSDGINSRLKMFEEAIGDYVASSDIREDLSEAIENRCLFRDCNGGVFLYKAHLVKWVADRHGLRIGPVDADVMLKRLGFQNIEKHQRKTKKNMWQVPGRFLPAHSRSG